jgi:hypothetical protein
MESTTGSRSVSLGWKLLIFLPLAAALVLLLMSSRQTDLREGIELQSLGSIFVQVSLIAVGVFWIVERKLMGIGILVLIVASAVLGFGLHTLLRMR